MHAILVSIGTDGDIFPYIALGTRLRSRGHRVTLASCEQYRALAVELGFSFCSLVSNEEMHEVLANADFWHPVKSGIVGARWGVRAIPRQYQQLADLTRDANAVLIANPGVLAARIVQEKLGVPLATLLLQPGMLPSVSAPPVLPAGPTLPGWAPWPIGRLYFWLIDALGGLLFGRDLNRFRASLNLKPVRRVFRWWLAPELVIGMFPDWYAPPQADWPTQIKLVGFPLDDGRPEKALPADVLEFCGAGEPPIVFTLGTGMMHAAEFFREAVEACRTLGARGLFLTKYRQQLPDSLPPFARHCEFAPFLQLFPGCAAVVHHGGVGTTAKALASGTPQLILPLAWDQPDNAARVKRLEVGAWLRPSRRSSRHLVEALTGLRRPRMRERCRELAARFGNHDALEIAANLVEEFACRRGTKFLVRE
jgi:rhamnosyltransferase subunit B